MADKKRMNFKDMRNKFKANAPYNHPNNYGKEGEDHINISIQSDTRIGKIFDPAYLKVINYKHVGKFNSVLSLWYWVRSANLDDNIRRLTGRNLKTYAEMNGVFNKFVPNFKAIIAQATWNKIRNYPGILKEIKELNPEIKLLSYHIVKSSSLRICTNYAAMITEIADCIIKAVKEGKEPDFSAFVDTKDKAGLMYLEGVLANILPASRIEEMKNTENHTDEEEDPEMTDPVGDEALANAPAGAVFDAGAEAPGSEAQAA